MSVNPIKTLEIFDTTRFIRKNRRIETLRKLNFHFERTNKISFDKYKKCVISLKIIVDRNWNDFVLACASQKKAFNKMVIAETKKENTNKIKDSFKRKDLYSLNNPFTLYPDDVNYIPLYTSLNTLYRLNIITSSTFQRYLKILRLARKQQLKLNRQF